MLKRFKKIFFRKLKQQTTFITLNTREPSAPTMLNCARFARARLAPFKRVGGAILKTIAKLNKTLKRLNINKCLKCGRGRFCVAYASVRCRTAVSEWIAWTLPSCPRGGSAKSAPISNQKSRILKKLFVTFAFGTQGNIFICPRQFCTIIY
jgi:hypothetical protein